MAVIDRHRVFRQDYTYGEVGCVPAANELSILVDGSAGMQFAIGFGPAVLRVIIITKAGAHIAALHLGMLLGIIVDVTLKVLLWHNDVHTIIVAKRILVLATIVRIRI